MIKNRLATVAVLAFVVQLAACSAHQGTTNSANPVSVGYGEQDRALFAGAVSSISNDGTQNYSTIEEMLARVPGVHVARGAQGQFSLRIRGVSTITGSTDPLVVIDGLAVADWGVTSALAAVNPKDVARIDVLKDGAAAIYGVRGSNGVIIITTKR